MDPISDPLPPEPLSSTPSGSIPPPSTVNPGPAGQPSTQHPDETARLLAAWQITPETHAHILHTQILPTELHPFLPSPTSSTLNLSPRRPLAVLLLGQTGAGKTRLAPLLLSALSSQESGPPPLHLIADTYKTYHPSYSVCLASHRPDLASRLTSAAAAAWLHSVCLHAAQARVQNVLVETACRREGDFERLVGAFRGEEYVVRVVALAVPAALSRLGVMVRYCKQTNKTISFTQQTALSSGCVSRDGAGGVLRERLLLPMQAPIPRPPHPTRAPDSTTNELTLLLGMRLPEAGSRGLPVRLTPRVVHDGSFGGVGGAVGWVDSSCGHGSSGYDGREGGDGDGDGDGRGTGGGQVDRVVVLRRGGGVVYQNEKGSGGEWIHEPGALRALERERGRVLSEEERRRAEEDMEMLRQLGDPKVDRELEEIERLIAGLGVDGTASEMVPFDAVGFVMGGLS